MLQRYVTREAAWWGLCRQAYLNGIEYKIGRGSFEGQMRKQLESLAFMIEHPHKRPLAIFHKGKCIVTDEQIEEYFQNYLFSDHISAEELYTYGSRIHRFIPNVIDMLKNTKNTNQAVVEVAYSADIIMEHPPCLRLLDWKVVDGKVNLHCYFRSWDLYQGLPTNLGGLQLLNEYVASEAGMEAGKLICYSSGAHLYSNAWSEFE